MRGKKTRQQLQQIRHNVQIDSPLLTDMSDFETHASSAKKQQTYSSWMTSIMTQCRLPHLNYFQSLHHFKQTLNTMQCQWHILLQARQFQVTKYS